MAAETKIHDVRIVEMVRTPKEFMPMGTGHWAGLYIDGILDSENFEIDARDIARVAAGRPITVKRGRMRISEDCQYPISYIQINAYLRFPENISELDKREKDFQVFWDDCGP